MTEIKEEINMKGITTIVVAVIALLLIVPAASVLATDQGTASDTNTTLRCYVQTGLPIINSVKLMDSTGALRNNTQIDVLQTYYFEINATQDAGWLNITYVNITLSYDFGDDSALPTVTTTNNTQFRLVYDNTTGTESFGLAAAGLGEVTFNGGSITYVNSTSSVLNFSFTPNNEIRHATGAAGTNNGPGFNDLNSWNYRVNATNTDGQTSSNWDDEFGVYRYTTVSAATDPEGTGSPGYTIPLNTNGDTTVTYSANEQFTLTVAIGDLSDGTNTITADNVDVTGGNLANANFASGGSTQYIYGSATPTYHAAYDTYNPSVDHTVTTSWQISIPFGTPTGTYTSTVTYTITVA